MPEQVSGFNVGTHFAPTYIVSTIQSFHEATDHSARIYNGFHGGCDRIGLWSPFAGRADAGRNNGLPSRFGYAELFDQWSVTPVSDMVRRDRNHASVIMWSIGNEIDYGNDPFTHPVLGNDYRPANPPAQDIVTCARPLIAAVKRLDPTRPVTAALATVTMSDAVGFAEMLDVVGYNYQESRHATDHQSYPKRFIYGLVSIATAAVHSKIGYSYPGDGRFNKLACPMYLRPRMSRCGCGPGFRGEQEHLPF